MDKLTVIGKLPDDLNGLYVRNGPNPRLPPKGAYHWFDGDGMIHGVRIENGRASYRNRFIATAGYLHEMKKGRAVWNGLTSFPSVRQLILPPKGLYAKNVANTALVWHAGRLLALWEVGEPHFIDVPGLETIGQMESGLSVKAFTAHPKVDPVNGEMIFFGMQIGPRPRLHYGIYDHHGQLLHSTRIPLAESVLMHDFAITRHYTVFMDLPYVFSLKAMLTKGVPLTFKASRPARFAIMPRYGKPDDIIWFEDDACFVFHTMNASEITDADGSVKEIVLLASRMKQGTIAALPGHSAHKPNRIASKEPMLTADDAGRLHQWRFNLKTGTVKSNQLDDHPSDFPRCNDQLIGNANRYGYVARVQVNRQNSTPEFTEITKHDLHSDSQSSYCYGANRFGGEALFVPRRPSSTPQGPVQVAKELEDDGWLLSHVFDTNTNSSELLIIDAKTMDAEPVARIVMPQRIPYGFHGTWIPSGELDNA